MRGLRLSSKPDFYLLTTERFLIRLCSFSPDFSGTRAIARGKTLDFKVTFDPQGASSSLMHGGYTAVLII